MSVARIFGISLLLSVSCGSPQTESKVSTANPPHSPQKGPWFEGWYARVTDLGGNRSIAVIAASHLPKDQRFVPDADMPGYIGVLYSEGDGSPTKSWTFFPDKTRLKSDGQWVTQNPNIFSENDGSFSWEADGFGSFRTDGLSLHVPGEIDLEMTFGESKPWEESSFALPLGPEGYLAVLPVPLHWYVESLASPTHYSVKVGQEETIEGDGLAHLEKNWGQVFPKAWNWLQGLSVTDDAQIALGGGAVGLGPVDLHAWLAGYRSPKENWTIRFSDPLTKITTEQDPCAGEFHFKAKRPGLEVEIDAKANPDTFGPVAVPTRDGFVENNGAESFSATLVVKTYRLRLKGRELTDERTFSNAALEFGAGSYCSLLTDKK